MIEYKASSRCANGAGQKFATTSRRISLKYILGNESYMSSFQTKRRNALSAVLPEFGDNEKQSILSPPSLNTQPCTPTTPTGRSPRPTLSPKETLRLGEYHVSIDAFLAYCRSCDGIQGSERLGPLTPSDSDPKLEDHFVESYQVTAQKYSGNGHESKKTCTLRKIPFASAALKRACEHEQLILVRSDRFEEYIYSYRGPNELYF